MVFLRFKEKFIHDIQHPKRNGYKTKTTRRTLHELGEYEIAFGLPPNPMFYLIRTGIYVKITKVEHKKISDYTCNDLICDVGHADMEQFITELNTINKSKFNKDSKLYLHSFEISKIKPLTAWQKHLNELSVMRAEKKIESMKRNIDKRIKKMISNAKSNILNGCE